MFTLLLIAELVSNTAPRFAPPQSDAGVLRPAPLATGPSAADAGVCSEYLWARTGDCALKTEYAVSSSGDTSVGFSKVKASVACGAEVLVCGFHKVCACLDAGS